MSSEEFLNVACCVEQTEKDKKLRKGNVASVDEVQTNDSDSDAEVNAVKNKGKAKNRNEKKRQERKSDQKKETICWYCQKAGHIKLYCPELKAQKAEKWRKVNEAAASGQTEPPVPMMNQVDLMDFLEYYQTQSFYSTGLDYTAGGQVQE